HNPTPGTVDHHRSITAGDSHRSACCSASVITVELSVRQRRGSQRPSGVTAELPTETVPVSAPWTGTRTCSILCPVHRKEPPVTTMATDVQPSSHTMFEVRNPATGEQVGQFPIHTAADIAERVAQARRAQQWWAEQGFDG